MLPRRSWSPGAEARLHGAHDREKFPRDMIRPRFTFWSLAASTLLGLGLAASSACSNQGEGQRCSTFGENGGNDDCVNGLVCTAKNLLNGAQDDLCCPQDRTPATVSEKCRIPQASVVGDASPQPRPDATPPDAAPPDAAPPDAAADAAGDATLDASSDAPDGG